MNTSISIAAIRAGVQLIQMGVRQARVLSEDGKITDEQYAEIMAEADRVDDRWDEAVDQARARLRDGMDG